MMRWDEERFLYFTIIVTLMLNLIGVSSNSPRTELMCTLALISSILTLLSYSKKSSVRKLTTPLWLILIITSIVSLIEFPESLKAPIHPVFMVVSLFSYITIIYSMIVIT